MTWVWTLGVLLAAVAGVVTGAVATREASLEPILLGLAVGLMSAGYPAMRLVQIIKGTAPAVEWLSFEVGPGTDRMAVLGRAVPRLGVPAVRMVDVPADLVWAARDLITRAVEHVRTQGGVKPGTVEARLDSPQQQLPHRLTLSSLHGAPTLLVLHGEEGPDAFALRLMAFHLNTLAEPLVGLRPGQQLLERSIDLWPGDSTSTVPADGTPPDNENNCMAYKGLGDTLVESGQLEEGVAALRLAVARSPGFARRFRDQVRQAVAEQKVSAEDARVKFWLGVVLPGEAAP